MEWPACAVDVNQRLPIARGADKKNHFDKKDYDLYDSFVQTNGNRIKYQIRIKKCHHYSGFFRLNGNYVQLSAQIANGK